MLNGSSKSVSDRALVDVMSLNEVTIELMVVEFLLLV